MLKICLTVLAQLPIVAPRCPPSGQAAIQYGEVSEWLKEHAWKVCIRQRIGGSNPPLTAIFKMRARTKVWAFFFYIPRKGGDENPRQGFDNWRQPVGQTESVANRLPAGRAQASQSPLTAIFKMRARTKVRAFFFWIATRGFEPWNSLHSSCLVALRLPGLRSGFCRSGKRSASRHHAGTKKARFLDCIYPIHR